MFDLTAAILIFLFSVVQICKQLGDEEMPTAAIAIALLSLLAGGNTAAELSNHSLEINQTTRSLTTANQTIQSLQSQLASSSESAANLINVAKTQIATLEETVGTDRERVAALEASEQQLGDQARVALANENDELINEQAQLNDAASRLAQLQVQNRSFSQKLDATQLALARLEPRHMSQEQETDLVSTLRSAGYPAPKLIIHTAPGLNDANAVVQGIAQACQDAGFAQPEWDANYNGAYRDGFDVVAPSPELARQLATVLYGVDTDAKYVDQSSNEFDIYVGAHQQN